MPEALTEREETIIALVTRAFPKRMLEATVVDVKKLEGGEVPTLRFTVDESASTDIERERIKESTEALELLANQAETELRQQLP